MWLSKIYNALRENWAFTNFVIDEKPVTVWRDESLEGAEGEQEGQEEDLLTIISKILREREELLSLTEHLKNNRSKGDDLDHLTQRFITFFDSFDRILYLGRSGPETEFMANWLKAVETLYFRIKDLFEQRGLIEMKCIGKTVDLDFHEVVELRKTTDYPADTIIAERQKGYIYKGKVLRDAQVVVATNERS